MSEVLPPRPRVPPAPTEPPARVSTATTEFLPRVTSGAASVVRRPHFVPTRVTGRKQRILRTCSQRILQKLMLSPGGLESRRTYRGIGTSSRNSALRSDPIPASSLFPGTKRQDSKTQVETDLTRSKRAICRSPKIRSGASSTYGLDGCNARRRRWRRSSPDEPDRRL